MSRASQGLLPAIGLVAIVGFIVFASRAGSSSSETFAKSAPTHHGWALAPHKILLNNEDEPGQDLYDSPELYCDALKVMARRIEDSRETGSDPSSLKADNIPGQHLLPVGTWVDLVGHENYACGTTVLTMSKVRIRDGRSNLNNALLYIPEGSLSKQ